MMMFAGQVRVTPDVNVDGYFTNIRQNAKVLLRRTLSGKLAQTEIT